MKSNKIVINSFITIIGVVVVFLSSPKVAHAYLDFGSGSYLTQILLASLLGVGFIIKSSWRNIKKYINNIIKIINDGSKKETKGKNSRS